MLPLRPSSASKNSVRRDFDRSWTPRAKTMRISELKCEQQQVENRKTVAGRKHELAADDQLLHLFGDESIEVSTGATKHDQAQNAQVVFKNIFEKLKEEAVSFSSFSNACDAAMTRAEVACSEIDHPRQLEASVAASVLLKITPFLGSVYGPLVHRAVLRLMQGTFASIPQAILESTPQLLPSDLDLLELVRIPSFGSRSKALMAELDLKTLELKSARNTLLTNSAHLFFIAERNSSRRLRSSFDSWRKLANRTKNFGLHFEALNALQSQRVQKRDAFLRWVAFVHTLKDSRTTRVASANHELLSNRLTELTSRCTQRDDQLSALRVAKEKLAARCERLEELYGFEKEELGKCRAKLVSMDQEIQRFRQSSVYVFQLFDRMTCTIPLFIGGSTISDLTLNASLKRDLNIKRNVAPIRQPTSSAATVPSRLCITPEFLIPHHVHGGGSASLEGYVDDAYLVVQRWVNVARDEVRQFIESSRSRKLSNSHDAFASSMEEDDLFRALADAEQVTAHPIREFGRDLSDGRVYHLILWRLLCHRYGSTAFLCNNQLVAPYPSIESVGERMDVVVRMSRLLGVDGGYSGQDWVAITGTSDARRQHFLFCVRIMSLHATCTPHFTKLASSRQGHVASAMTASHVHQLVQSVHEKLDLCDRWSIAVRAVNNYASSVATGSAQLDAGSHRSPSVNKDFLVQRQVILEQALPQVLRFAKEAPSSLKRNEGHFFGGDNRTVESEDEAGAPGDALQYQTQTIQATTFLWSEMNHIIALYATELQRVAWYYGALTSSDVSDCVWDTPAWQRFVQDSNLNSDRHISKSVSDSVFRSLAAPNQQAVAAAIVSLQPSQLQPRLSNIGSASPQAAHGRPGSGATGRPSSIGAPSTDAEDDANVSHFYSMPISKFPTAIARLFLARSLNPPMSSMGWLDVDRAVELFREFVVQVILSSAVNRSIVDGLVANFQDRSVQDVLKLFKEPLRKIFNDVATRDTTTQLSRIRMESFLHFVTREAKLMPISDASDAQCVYQTCRIAGTILSPLSKSATLLIPGLDVNGFHVALMILSRIKFGFGLITPAAALQQFLVGALFPTCQFKLKLKW